MKLTDDELWAKCATDEPITSEDLGLPKPREDGFYVINDGLSQGTVVIAVIVVVVGMLAILLQMILYYR